MRWNKSRLYVHSPKIPEVYNSSPLIKHRIQKGKQLSIHFSGANWLVKLRGCISFPIFCFRCLDVHITTHPLFWRVFGGVESLQNFEFKNDSLGIHFVALFSSVESETGLKWDHFEEAGISFVHCIIILGLYYGFPLYYIWYHAILFISYILYLIYSALQVLLILNPNSAWCVGLTLSGCY